MATWQSATTFAFTNAAGATYTAGYFQFMKALRDGLVACGMVQTTDTGQLDLTTLDTDTAVPAALGANSISGFIILRMNDTLQATKPFFIKLRVHTAASSSNLAGLHIQYGSGTDGAGNLTGYGSSGAYLPYVSHNTGQNFSNRRHAYCSGNGSEFAFHIRDSPNVINNSDLSIMLTIERTRDELGAYDGEGVLIQLIYGWQGSVMTGNSWYYAVLPTNGTTPTLRGGFIRGGIYPQLEPHRTTYIIGNNFGPLTPMGGGFLPKFRQSNVLWTFPHNDFQTYGGTFTIPLYGVTRTLRNSGYAISYYNVGSYTPGSTAGTDTIQTTMSLGMLWE